MKLDDSDTEVYGFTTDEPEKMAGVSGADLMYIIDEASGVDESIYEAIEGNMAGGGSQLLISNPTQTSGTFYEAFTTKRHLWKTLHISSEDTPNVISGEILIPGLATRAWVQEKLSEWGEDSPLFQVRVRGDFPDQAENSVMGLALIEAARARYNAAGIVLSGAFALGVDVARYGDDTTVLQPLFGQRPGLPKTFRKQDNVEVAGHVMDYVEQLRQAHGYPVASGKVKVKVDDLGNGGGVTDHLKHSERAKALGIEVCPVLVSNSATAAGYSKLRDQLWFALRDWFKEGGQLHPDSHLEGELVAPLYTFDTQGRAKVESKDDMKKRLGRSPDRADALALAVYEPPSGPLGGIIVSNGR
jgi:phage terminase large subunit